MATLGLRIVLSNFPIFLLESLIILALFEVFNSQSLVAQMTKDELYELRSSPSWKLNQG